ncbi:hypothetical protein RclHR1_09560008 [Rhizophagus clarus]|uniref:Crinkler effector protein N-terminal domain-containing protein n=1 Tax=Rhizophagus clarus TaxID=94130 RepID=A0A2Z6S4T8_9GLOM|nr:hypothetical protein RclHR1_09560008 [Rhizophagus clarus]
MLFRPIRNRKLDNWHLKTSTSRKYLGSIDVGDLIPIIKVQLKIKGDIAIRSGSDSLEESKLVTELFNTENNAYEITVEGNDDGSSSSKVKEIELEKESNIEVKRIENAFHVNYQGSALDTFYERLILFHDEWRNRETPYAPYLTIIQSSGSGKTRLVGELRTKGVFVLYICKRQQNSSGYPILTPYAQQIFEKIRDNKFVVLLSEAIKLIKNNNWNEGEFWELQVKAEYENTRTQFWKRVLESVESLSQHNNLLSNKDFVKDLFDKDSPISVVCCIDEAHELLERTSITNDETYFVRWRRQIRNIMWHGFFNVLLSTNGKVGNFLPPEIKDTHSARMHEYFLFPAYLDVHTIDVLARIAPPGKSYDPQRALYLGIPLWGSLAQTGVDITNVLHLASQKIRNFNKKQEKDHLANLACMSCSFALQVCPRIAEVEMLIASHMATAIGVSDNRTDLLCTYPSDPILASGALKDLIIEVGLEDCLDTLLEQFSRGVVEAGERGELVSRILFLEAYVRIMKINQLPPVTYLEKVPLSLFLKALCKGIDEKIDDLLVKMHINEAEIGFNHWTSLLASNKQYVKEGGQKYLSENLIQEAYHRHTAFKMPLGFPVIDYVIPFKYSTNKYGIISIQNKNAKKTKYQDGDVPVLVHPRSAFDNNNFKGVILGIYIDTGTSNQSIEIKEVDSKELRGKTPVTNRAIYIENI